MNTYVEDTYTLLHEKASKDLQGKLKRDASFPRGPAGRSVALTHMSVCGYSAEHIAEAREILVAAGIK